MKKVMALGDTKCRDNRVDSAARRHSARSERAMVMRGGNRDRATSDSAKFERLEHLFRAPKLIRRRKALQHLGHDQIANHQQLAALQPVERIGFRGWPAVEIVYPYRGIDHDHRRDLRSRRIAFRSPSQWSLPRSEPINFSCSARRTISSRLRWTASRLVLAPDTRIARLINSSSITILVRMGSSDVYAKRCGYTSQVPILR